MKFNEIDRCGANTKRVSSLSPMRKSAFCQSEKDEYFRPRSIGVQSEPIRLLAVKAGSSCQSSKKAMAAADLPQSSEEDLDLCQQFGNDPESMWLSSDCSSPSAFFREYRWSDSSSHSNELGLPSWLSLPARTYPREEASNMPIRRTFRDEDDNLKEDTKGEQTVTWLRTSATSDADARWSYEEYSPSCDDSSTHPSTESNSSQSLDFERVGDNISLLNLDGDDDRLVPDTYARVDCFLCDFPSPSYTSNWGHEFQSPNSSTISTPSDAQTEITGFGFASEHASESADLQDFETDEPLFWPLERQADWNSQATWNYFSMSPRKCIGITTSETPPDSSPLRYHGRNMDIKEGQRKRLVFSSGSAASKIMKLKQKYNKGVLRRTNTLRSRLSRGSPTTSEKIVPLHVKDEDVEVQNGEVHFMKRVAMVEDFHEEDFASKEVPIEMFLGLDEFDGHEGVDPEFNKDEFSLHVSLC